MPTIRSRTSMVRLAAFADRAKSKRCSAARRSDWKPAQRALVARLSEGAAGRALGFPLEAYLASRQEALVLLRSATTDSLDALPPDGELSGRSRRAGKIMTGFDPRADEPSRRSFVAARRRSRAGEKHRSGRGVTSCSRRSESGMGRNSSQSCEPFGERGCGGTCCDRWRWTLSRRSWFCKVKSPSHLGRIQ